MSDKPQGNPGNFSGKYAEQELAFFGRVQAAEWRLLQFIYGLDLYGDGDDRQDALEGFRIASAEGVTRASFIHDDSRLLWLIAGEGNALKMARFAEKQHKLNVGRFDSVSTAAYFCPERTLAAAIELLALIADEAEARLCAARYIALLTGKVHAKVILPKLQELRAA